MKAKEIKAMEKSALNEKLLELKKELVKINAQVAIGTALKNPGQVRKIKKALARILTINSQKDLKKIYNRRLIKKHE
ncbi:50S ribosomal protein L29 [Candidatus Woesearchaeota archaeon]|jgi:large subunit ribosomal protein L29|nr:50S ribosomal protein L29 [Candidatus Woesearchaeota archaeon]|tara:strand:- start:684 stop:914 length:231 start_codon:yes stop_codon:yes gene_type:complete